MPEQKTMNSQCRLCKRETRHNVLHQLTIDSGSEDYHCATKYYTLECCGCQNPAFRVEFHDYEVHWQVGPDEWEHDTSTEIYPHFIEGHNVIEHTSDIPNVVFNIYSESVRAVQEGAFTIAGLGLRATIESVCNDKEIKGRNLQTRIDNMAKEGLISKLDAKRLHAIRFMGNDAAHEIKTAAKESVLVALKIVEHLVLNVYVYERQVNMHLETPIDSVAKLLEVLEDKLPLLDEKEAISLTKWLGSDRRRVIDNFQQLELEFIEHVRTSGFDGVEIAGEITLDGRKIQGFRKKSQIQETVPV